MGAVWRRKTTKSKGEINVHNTWWDQDQVFQFSVVSTLIEVWAQDEWLKQTCSWMANLYDRSPVCILQDALKVLKCLMFGQERSVLIVECVKPVWMDQIIQTTKKQPLYIQNCPHLRMTMWQAASFMTILQPLYSCLINLPLWQTNGKPHLCWDLSCSKQSHVLIHVKWTATEVIWIE